MTVCWKSWDQRTRHLVPERRVRRRRFRVGGHGPRWVARTPESPDPPDLLRSLSVVLTPPRKSGFPKVSWSYTSKRTSTPPRSGKAKTSRRVNAMQVRQTGLRDCGTTSVFPISLSLRKTQQYASDSPWLCSVLESLALISLALVTSMLNHMFDLVSWP